MTDLCDCGRQIDAYKRQNDKLRGELDRCMEAQFRLREVEDALRNKDTEVKQMKRKNFALEKMLDKKEPKTEEDRCDQERVSKLMQDVALLQEKTRKYKARANDAEREVRSMANKMADLQSKQDKMMALLKEYQKKGADPSLIEKLEEKISASSKEASDLKRKMQIEQKRKGEDIKKYKKAAVDASREADALRDGVSKVSEALKESEQESRILQHKLKNERSKRKSYHVEPIPPAALTGAGGAGGGQTSRVPRDRPLPPSGPRSRQAKPCRAPVLPPWKSPI